MKTTTQEALNILREFKQIRGKKYGIEKIGLFGSTARGEQQDDSDIDVCMKVSGTIFAMSWNACSARRWIC